MISRQQKHDEQALYLSMPPMLYGLIEHGLTGYSGNNNFIAPLDNKHCHWLRLE